ncbi:hypothetical protein PL11201_490088 [Planktothrix sp. PCC 11201]|uniref:hypothetical protein n=1 Tax=Planktothrix sp. PCC 11201 TaxID=1729650 RepID=UPI0009133E6B|nr:hypothetical protein [Planktothrix sp. PCC 11201]SKB12034.1 hypothetical protein PL11201_290002 [Planktothrix sp. PCC 11201]SKB13353.1 hypothetical protein PL11201_490088 [Planktothrix sp. PCC 11201]
MAGKGGNTKSDIDFRLSCPTVRIPKPYHRACQEYAKELENRDVESGKVYQADDGKWYYRD